MTIPYSYTCTAKSSGCFAGFETVTMESGERKAIGEVSVGDKILAYSPTRVTNCIRCAYYMYCMYERHQWLRSYMYVCMYVWKYLQYELLQCTSIYIYVIYVCIACHVCNCVCMLCMYVCMYVCMGGWQ